MHPVDIWDKTDTWGHIALILIITAALAQTVFVLVYAARPWRRLTVGRALMFLALALLIALWANIINLWFRYPGQEEVSAFTTLIIASAICYQLWVLIRAPSVLPPTGLPERHAEKQPPS